MEYGSQLVFFFWAYHYCTSRTWERFSRSVQMFTLVKISTFLLAKVISQKKKIGRHNRTLTKVKIDEVWFWRLVFFLTPVKMITSPLELHLYAFRKGVGMTHRSHARTVNQCTIEENKGWAEIKIVYSSSIVMYL